MSILEKILASHPIRRTDAQKQAFRECVKTLCEEHQLPYKVEELEQNQNIVIGNPQTAKVILTAHYDTPARLPFPNFIVPQICSTRLQ